MNFVCLLNCLCFHKLTQLTHIHTTHTHQVKLPNQLETVYVIVIQAIEQGMCDECVRKLIHRMFRIYEYRMMEMEMNERIIV